MPALGAAGTVAILAGALALARLGANLVVTTDAAGDPRRHRTAPSATVQSGNTPYDGRFTFARIRFGTGLSSRSFRGRGRRGQAPWAHDFPRAERNFMNIIRETTLIRPYMDGGNVFDTDDPELTRFPLAYISEPGFWYPSDEEILGLRNYLMKGGFLIADDFDGRDWFNFDAQMKKVIPGAQFVQLDESHAIFDSFFRIESLATLLPPYFRSARPPMALRIGRSRRWAAVSALCGVHEYASVASPCPWARLNSLRHFVGRSSGKLCNGAAGAALRQAT